ncbi:MAG: hypothetical protein K5656_09655 [Lachnospiraceae bacterium]|nr:hypothetical protein [Lachnospiraceae bacterium]
MVNKSRRIIAVIIAFAVLFSSFSYNIKTASAKDIYETSAYYIKKAKGKDINYYKTWEDDNYIKISSVSGKLNISITNQKESDGTVYSATLSGNNNEVKASLKNHKLSIKLDVSSTINGSKTLDVMNIKNGYRYYIFTRTINFTKGKAVFHMGAGASEKAFVKSLYNLDPSLYNGVAKDIKKLKNYPKMKKKAKKIIADCKTDEEKARAIHDWLAKNIQYDHVTDIYEDTANPGKVFANRRGVCGGYTRLAKVFFGVANIPCLEVLGRAESDNINSGQKYYYNHVWNLVYINKEWKVMDITWDSSNKYYGKDSPYNVSKEKAKHKYYLTDPVIFGEDHLSLFIGTNSYSDKYFGKYSSKGIYVYKIVGKNKAILYKAYSTGKKTSVIDVNDYAGEFYYTVGIAPYAFDYKCKSKTLMVISSYLESDKFKNALKASNISTVEIYRNYMTEEELANTKNCFSASKVGKKAKIVTTTKDWPGY